MMKKIFVFMFLSVSLFAHNLIMNVIDNKDNTITVIGEFSTGEDAAGALVRVESLISGDVLYKERLPEASEVTITIPKEPYQVVLDGGPGHTIVKEGIAPLEGFKEELKSKIDSTKKLSVAQNANNEWDLITIVFFVLCLILFAMAIYFSNKNTNKILQQLKEN
ncbi:hypothetical protein [Aliarcobacter butzleri]|uniref:hypothetical protein n=3 Tax=Aliarcobacter butzleri TaxID=28197 RepID=UPI0036F4A869